MLFFFLSCCLVSVVIDIKPPSSDNHTIARHFMIVATEIFYSVSVKIVGVDRYHLEYL